MASMTDIPIESVRLKNSNVNVGDILFSVKLLEWIKWVKEFPCEGRIYFVLCKTP